MVEYDWQRMCLSTWVLKCEAMVGEHCHLTVRIYISSNFCSQNKLAESEMIGRCNALSNSRSSIHRFTATGSPVEASTSVSDFYAPSLLGRSWPLGSNWALVEDLARFEESVCHLRCWRDLIHFDTILKKTLVVWCPWWWLLFFCRWEGQSLSIPYPVLVHFSAGKSRCQRDGGRDPSERTGSTDWIMLSMG